MNKKEWLVERKKLVKHLEIAEKNLKTAENQIEELALTIGAYDNQIETFK